MKRRPFLTGLTTIGAAALVPKQVTATSANSNASESTLEQVDAYEENPVSLLKLDNAQLTFEWFSDASATIVSKTTQATWRMGKVALQEPTSIDLGHVWVRQDRSLCEQYPGRFKGQRTDNGIRFTLLGLRKQVMGTFDVQATLNEANLEITITNIDPRLKNLGFPTPIESEALVLPMGVGRLIRKPLHSRSFHTYFSHLNMRWFGGLDSKLDKGWMAIPGQNFENSGIMVTGLSIMPTWLPSLGSWEPTRTIQYSFTANGYVGQAKAFRAYAQKNGLFKTLTQKIKEAPELANMVGGRIISFVGAWPARTIENQENNLRPIHQTDLGTIGKLKVLNTFADIPKRLEDLKKAGFKKGIINIRGWIRGGYDYSHPDVWPPETALGTVEELKKVCAIRDGYSVVLHDNYQDSYEQNPSFPKGVNQTKNGDLMLGGFWAGGQSYIMNYKDGLAYGKRNWEQIKQLRPSGMFMDTITAMQLYENFDPANKVTRQKDLQLKADFIKYYKNKGLLFGSEESADFGIPLVDWLECRHSRVPGESVPLWPLVYHDCVMMGRYNGVHESLPKAANTKEYPKHLEDMIWGYFMCYWAHSDEDQAVQAEAVKATTHVDAWFGEIATSEMVNHYYLTDDFQVEKTVFANGKSIIVNFSGEARTVEGSVIQPFSYRIA